MTYEEDFGKFIKATEDMTWFSKQVKKVIQLAKVRGVDNQVIANVLASIMEFMHSEVNQIFDALHGYPDAEEKEDTRMDYIG